MKTCRTHREHIAPLQKIFPYRPLKNPNIHIYIYFFQPDNSAKVDCDLMQTMLSCRHDCYHRDQCSTDLYVKNYFYFDVNKVNFRASVEMYVA